MEGNNFCCYEFNEFRLDGRRRSLTKNGEKVPLSARNFDLLLFMVENSGRILEHDELLDKVWAGTFVEQATLKKGISALRQILVENAENEFIKTIPRRGYSFVSPVRVIRDENEIQFTRETEHEIIVEEIIETDDEEYLNDLPANRELPARTMPGKPGINKNLPRLAIFCSVGIIIFVLVVFGLKPYLSKSVKSQFSVENVRVTRITNNGKVIGAAVVSPDGNYLLYPAAEDKGVSLWIRQMSVNSTNRLTLPLNGSFWGYTIPPDNSYVYYIVNNTDEPAKSGLYKIPLLGGEPRRVKENVSSVVISPDGKRMSLVRITGETHIMTTNLDGEDEREIFTLGGDSRLWGISWTPDGKSLLCTIRKTIENKTFFYISEINAETLKETTILPMQDKFIFGAAWLPDKSAIILTMHETNADIRQIWQYFPDSLEWQRVTNDNNSYKLISLDRDGKTIVTNQESRLAAIWLAETGTIERTAPKSKSLLDKSDNFRQITSGVSNFDRISWLADGRLMYSATEDGKETIFTMNSDGVNTRQITDGEDGTWISPHTSGNRQTISLLSSRAGSKQVWRIDADGKNLTKMTDTELPVVDARILQDNTTVLFASTQNKKIVLVRQTGDGQKINLTHTETGYFAVSPDEKLIAAETMDESTNKFRIELISIEDGKTIKTFSFQPGRQIIFTPDGKNLAYDEIRGDVSQIMIQPLEGGEPFALTDFQSEKIFSFDWSPDGKSLAVIRGKQLNDAVLIKSNNRQ